MKSQCQGDRVRQIFGVHWPASVDYSVSSGPVRDVVSKNKVDCDQRRAEIVLQPPHECTQKTKNEGEFLQRDKEP